MSGHHGEGGGEHGKAIEHYRAIEHYLADPIHADRELYERWPGDAEGHKDFDRWQSFKRDSNWTAWHTAERERMQREFARSVDEAETYRRITLRQPPQQRQPSHPMGRLFESHL